MNLLIVDDNCAHAESTETYLHVWMALDIQLAFDGAEALQRALSQRPDVMLVDQEMPELNGVQVATRVRDHYGSNSPYMIAMTGHPLVSSQLLGIDAVFDRAFAKPLDLGELVATLVLLESGEKDVRRVARPLDLAEVLTRVARQLVPIAAARGILVSFDYQGSRIVVEDDPINLHCCLYRMVMELMDIVATSYVLLTVHVQALANDRFAVTVNAAASGDLKTDAEIDGSLERLDMTVISADANVRRRSRTAAGRCRNTQAELICSIDSLEGVLLCAQLSYSGQIAQGVDLSRLKCSGQAWFVDSHPVSPTLGERRLQGMGWVVRRFSSCSAALAELGEIDRSTPGTEPSPAPELLIVMESPAQASAEVAQLRDALPAVSTCVLAVMAGSPALGNPEWSTGYDVRVLPFSPLDLAEMCDALGRWREGDATPTMPAALGLEQRPTVLLVDDNAVNRLVGQAMLESLGYEVRLAHDGLDAIDQCRRHPPQVVLMDIDMPVLRGIEATRRLRELERLGAVPPVAVIAATADGSAQARLDCSAAGMNSFLTKPFTLSVLRAELQRFIDPVFRVVN
ncbi:MAG: response regulator [Chitinophagaceae bacterium]|nr:response regulator [Rubrivivax sp.]